jgi:pimeloyl-ACP methyl ester carboxylesterase
MTDRARVRAHQAIAIVLVSATVAMTVACGDASLSKEVSFPTADGGTVFADLYAASSPDAVVLAHGAAFDKASWVPFATWLAGRGHQVLAIDFRGHGRSMAGADSHALFEDVLAAVRYLHNLGVARVSVLGASMGGGAVAEAAVHAAPGEIDRVILVSPVPILDPENLRGPVLFICSQNEPMVAQMTEEYRRAPEPKLLVLLPGTAHAQHIFATEQAEDLRTTVAEFLERRATAKHRTDVRAVAVRGCPRAVAPVVLRTRLRSAPADRAGAQRRERRASP